jgi:hypothetical protein
MIIYSEVLTPQDTALSDIAQGGPAAEWLALSQALQERSVASFKIL